MEAPGYDLRNYEANSLTFYRKVQELANCFLDRAGKSSQFIVNHYIENYIQRESPKAYTLNELYFEFLSLGVYFKVYSNKAMKCPTIWLKISRKLNYWKKNKPHFKLIINFLRTIAFRRMNSIKVSKTIAYHQFSDLRSLINWMEASGEYTEEIISMRQWYNYLHSLSLDRANAVINRALELSDYFEKMSEEYLKDHTSQVANFIYISKEWQFKEDIFHRQRTKIEYHLNLIGKYILQNLMKEEFPEIKLKYIMHTV